jgi:hypothetical protein
VREPANGLAPAAVRAERGAQVGRSCAGASTRNESAQSPRSVSASRAPADEQDSHPGLPLRAPGHRAPNNAPLMLQDARAPWRAERNMPGDAVDGRSSLALNADVLVVGGGATGLAAAVTAARHRQHVILLERYGFCGGAAVAGLSGTVCGLYRASDDLSRKPEQLVFGFAEEFAALLRSRGGITKPIRYGKTFTLVHDPLVWREAADHLLAEAGVQVLYHTLVTDTLRNGERIEGVIAWTKQGRARVTARLVIDASGDADVAAMAGCGTSMGHDGQVQNPTMIFRLAGVDVDRFRARYGPDSILGDDVSQMIRNLHNSSEYNLPRAKVFLFPTPRPGELLCNCTRVIGRDGRELNPLLVEDLTEAEIEGRRQVREYARFFRDRLEGCENSFVDDAGVQVGVRQTRQIVGQRTLINDDVVKDTNRVTRARDRHGRSNYIPARSRAWSGSATIITTFRSAASCRATARDCLWPGVVFRPSTRPWRPHASRRSAFPTGKLSAWPPLRRCVRASTCVSFRSAICKSSCAAPAPLFRSLLARDLGVAVAQADGSIEHEPAWPRVGIRTEIALPLELHRVAGICARQRRLDACIANDFERVQVEIGEKFGSVRIWRREQGIVDSHFGRYRIGG